MSTQFPQSHRTLRPKANNVTSKAAPQCGQRIAMAEPIYQPFAPPSAGQPTRGNPSLTDREAPADMARAASRQAHYSTAGVESQTSRRTPISICSARVKSNPVARPPKRIGPRSLMLHGPFSSLLRRSLEVSGKLRLPSGYPRKPTGSAQHFFFEAFLVAFLAAAFLVAAPLAAFFVATIKTSVLECRRDGFDHRSLLPATVPVMAHKPQPSHA